jgi:hypothetical protein
MSRDRARRRETGTPGGTRTPDPQVRSLMLYPAELPARTRSPGAGLPARPGTTAGGADGEPWSLLWIPDSPLRCQEFTCGFEGIGLARAAIALIPLSGAKNSPAWLW